MKTEAQFPIDNGTTITVSCEERYIDSDGGSGDVTCNTYLYQDFEYATKTKCSRVGKSFKFELCTCIMLMFSWTKIKLSKLGARCLYQKRIKFAWIIYG